LREWLDYKARDAWTPDNTTYWAVSDVNLGDLETSARRFRDAPL
jgi:hypothetical protein